MSDSKTIKFNKLRGIVSKLGIISAILSIPFFGWSEEFLVKYKNSLGYKSIQSMSMAPLTSGESFSIMSEHSAGQYFKVAIEKSNKNRVLAKLLRNSNIEYVVPNFRLKAFGEIQKNPGKSGVALRQQWALEKIQADKAWTLAGNKGNRKVTVAVIDTGVDYNHESIKANAVPGYDFKDNDKDPMDKTGAQNPGHGTHCAGIIGATGTVNNGISGSSPEVSIMPLRFLGEDGSGDLDSGIKSIDYAISKNVDVISASWGATVPRAQALPLIEAVKRASDAGIIFVAAAANDGKNNDKTEVFPANAIFENTITVAASNSSDGKPSWSNYGKSTVALASPGDAIMSTLPGNKYGNLSGTSMATPLVSGLVAFLKAQDSSLTGAKIRALLQTSGAKVKIETACNCRIDASGATQYLVNKNLWLTPAAGTFAVNDRIPFEVVNGVSPFTFKSSNESVIKIDETGSAHAEGEGSATISVVDAKGRSASSLEIFVGKSSGGSNPPDPGQPDPGQPGQCPIGEQQYCDILCQIYPDLPFCTK